MSAPRWGCFPESPKVDHVSDTLAVLLEPFHFVDRAGRVWTAPAGMQYDGTSVPRVLWTAVAETPFTGDASWPAVIHDAGCKGLVHVDGAPREAAGFRDGLVHQRFYEGIRARGGHPLKAWSMYRGVWLYGMVRGGRST
jgi:Protein of unknown function (DUF1353)